MHEMECNPMNANCSKHYFQRNNENGHYIDDANMSIVMCNDKY